MFKDSKREDDIEELYFSIIKKEPKFRKRKKEHKKEPKEKGEKAKKGFSLAINVERVLGSLFKKEKKHYKYPSLNLKPAIQKPPEIGKDMEKFSWIYPLILPMAKAHIHFDPEIEELTYEVIEPKLNKEQEAHLYMLKNKLIDTVDIDLSRKEVKDAKNYIFERASAILDELNYDIDSKEYNYLLYYLYRDFVGLERLEPIMHDPYIEDISCDGTDVPIYILHRKYGPLRTNIIFEDAEVLNNFVVNLSQRCGRYISYARPYMDGKLPDGSRVNATFEKEITTRGSTFTIRKFKEIPLTPLDLIKNGTCSKDLMAYLWLSVENGASILIAGGTATGKTTILNAVSIFIPLDFKIVSIEDTRELNLPHEHWIPAIEKYGFGPPDVTGKRYGEVTMFELLKESFRQNPDCVIVGEVRGKEATVLFQGMASGHACLGTIHAADIQSVIDRLTLPPINVSSELLSNLDILVCLTRAMKEGPSARRIREISEVAGYDTHLSKINTEKVYVWNIINDKFEKRVVDPLKNFKPKTGTLISDSNEEIEDRKLVLSWMIDNNIEDLKEMSQHINRFREDREEFLNEIKKGKRKS
ncbi:MAG: type II/IV secretion system ATPase subunit [Candidatus Woesearchaeota archaeon]|nr:MAG: type II/IV secretion system ATPase subunit [Candidatus Woesearchaeota archaeon]